MTDDTAAGRMMVTEFLAWDSGPACRHELWQGRPVALPLPTAARTALRQRLAQRVEAALRLRHPGWQVLAGSRIAHSFRHLDLFVADLAVTATPRETEAAIIDRPILLAEVLSPATARPVRLMKLPRYMDFRGCQEIVLLDSRHLGADLFRRLPGERWLSDLLRGSDAVLTLDSVGLALELGELYHGLTLDRDA